MPESTVTTFLGSLTPENIQTWFHNFQRNAQTSLERLELRDYIRLIAIVGGYCLLRPYLVNLGGKHQAKDHERSLDASETSSQAAILPSSLRKQADSVLEDSDSEEDVKTGAGRTWGKSIRKKQRQTLKQILEAEERKEAADEADSDKEIEEFLQKVIR